jgi:hypothetical protein
MKAIAMGYTELVSIIEYNKGYSIDNFDPTKCIFDFCNRELKFTFCGAPTFFRLPRIPDKGFQVDRPFCRECHVRISAV